MGWREVLADWQDQWFADSKLSGRQYEIAREQSAERLLGMDAPDRIAMAWELLAGTGRVVAVKHERQPHKHEYAGLGPQITLYEDSP